MTAYEFYVQNETHGKRLIGILPERRTRQERISHEAIMNWAKLIFENILDMKNIFYKEITLTENGFGNIYSKDR